MVQVYSLLHSHPSVTLETSGQGHRRARRTLAQPSAPAGRLMEEGNQVGYAGSSC